MSGAHLPLRAHHRPSKELIWRRNATYQRFWLCVLRCGPGLCKGHVHVVWPGVAKHALDPLPPIPPLRAGGWSRDQGNRAHMVWGMCAIQCSWVCIAIICGVPYSGLFLWFHRQRARDAHEDPDLRARFAGREGGH